MAGRRALVVDGQRPAPAGDGAVVHHRHARRRHPLADAAGEGRRALAVEVALQPVADRLVQQHARPAGPHHHVHLAGRAGDGVEVDQGLAQRLVHLGAPAIGRDPGLEARPAARAGVGGLAFAVLLDRHRDVQPDERAHVAQEPPVRAQDLHDPPLAGDRGRDLHHARVRGPRVGVHLAQELDLVGEGGRGEGVVVAVELLVGRARPLGRDALVAALGQGRRFGRAPERGLADLVGVGVAGPLARHYAQTEALARVVVRRLQPSIVEHERFAFGPLEEQLPVVGARHGVAQDGQRALALDVGRFQK